MENILPADAFVVINKTIITDYDKKIISMLYQPIIGTNAANLFFSLFYELDKLELISNEETHHHLLAITRFTLDELVIAREKLEAIGLLKTYYKEEKTNSLYIYELFSPLRPNEFFSHPILNIVLYNNVGKNEYDKLVNYFKLPKIKLTEFKDITKSFDEVFESVMGTYFVNNLNDIKSENKLGININSNFDFNLLVTSFPKETLNQNAFNKDIKKLIINLSFIYNLDEQSMKNLIINSLNDKLLIDKTMLRKNARNYYQFENSGKLPTLIYKKDPKSISSAKANDKRSKMIYTFETVSPYNFLKSKHGGSNPPARDVQILEALVVDIGLRPAVVNVLIDYVMKINNQKLSKNFIETIAGQWKRLGIETAADAMNEAEKEYKNSKKYKKEKVVTTKKETALPEWFNKNVDKEEISVEEENELKDMLKEFEK